MPEILTRDEQAFRSICCTMVGVHFTPEQAKYLKQIIDMLTWPLSESKKEAS